MLKKYRIKLQKIVSLPPPQINVLSMFVICVGPCSYCPRAHETRWLQVTHTWNLNVVLM